MWLQCQWTKLKTIIIQIMLKKKRNGFVVSINKADGYTMLVSHQERDKYIIVMVFNVIQ
jgi:hypothetical protein